MQQFTYSLFVFLVFILSVQATLGQDTTLVVTATGEVGIGTTSPTEELDVDGNIAVSGTVDGVDISELESSYTQFGGLNSSSVTVTNTWTLLGIGSTKTFVKENADSKIEVFVNSTFSSGIFSGGASGIKFQIRVDGNPANVGNDGAIGSSASEAFISMMGIFENLPAGSHSVSIWGWTNNGSSSSVVVDPGGWGGRIIVKECW